MNPPDLEFCGDDDLIEELMKRYDHASFCGLKLPGNGEQLAVKKWKGNCFTVAGLLTHMITETDFHFRDSGYPPDGDYAEDDDSELD